MAGGGEQLSATNRLTYIFGADMTPGTSEAQAAAGFLAQHGSLFGGTFTDHEPEVRQLWSVTAKDESFTSFAYRQLIRGKEVEGSDIRIKVKRGTIARVDYAAARIAGEPTAGSENPYLTAEAASLFVRMWSGESSLHSQNPEVHFGTCRSPRGKRGRNCGNTRSNHAEVVLMCVGVALFPAVSAYAEDLVAALRELYPHAKVMHVGAQRAVMITPTANAPGWRWRGGGGGATECDQPAYLHLRALT